LLTIPGKAQQPVPTKPVSNLRVKRFTNFTDSIALDTLSIIPNSFSVINIPDTTYRLDYVRSILYWKKRPAADTVLITYRVFPYKLNEVVKATIKTAAPLAFDPYNKIRTNGSAILIDETSNSTVAAVLLQ